MSGADRRITIGSDDLLVTVDPRVGGTITSVVHRRLGVSVLGHSPWDTLREPIAGGAARDEAEWLTRYTGGWPLLFPNGGDACRVDGVFHGFHGEASIAPWTATHTPGRISLSRRFVTAPVEMQREICVDGDLLILRDRLSMLGREPVSVMWGHHPTFGSDLLAGPVEITCGARRATADATTDLATNPLVPGAAGAWPIVPGKAGPVDLSRPAPPVAVLAYLEDFSAPWAAIRRLDDSLAAALSWSGERFPCAWLWIELEGIAEAPWSGRVRMIGIEPNTTPLAHGIAAARENGAPLLELRPGDELSAELRLHVLKPTGPITRLDRDGRVVAAGPSAAAPDA